jgi:hypothetical protein
VILFISGILGKPEREPEIAGNWFLRLIVGSKSYYPNFLKPELPAPNFAGNPNAQGDS